MTRYVVLAVGQDFYFDASRGVPHVDNRELAYVHYFAPRWGQYQY